MWMYNFVGKFSYFRFDIGSIINEAMFGQPHSLNPSFVLCHHLKTKCLPKVKSATWSRSRPLVTFPAGKAGDTSVCWLGDKKILRRVFGIKAAQNSGWHRKVMNGMIVTMNSLITRICSTHLPFLNCALYYQNKSEKTCGVPVITT